MAKTEDLDEIEKQDIDEDKQATGVNEIAQATEEAPTELSVCINIATISPYHS